MKRRNVFQILLGSLAAITAKVRGTTAEFEVHVCIDDLEQMTLPTEDIRLDRGMDAALCEIGEQIQNVTNQMLADGATSVSIRWTNIRDAVKNPLGHVGCFLIRGYRTKDRRNLQHTDFRLLR